MHDLNKTLFKVFIGLVLLSFFILPANLVFADENSSASKIVFHVAWYDVGKSALEGLNGVKKVEKGFRFHKEINTVYYDPDEISIEEMEAVLKEAGTYNGVIEE